MVIAALSADKQIEVVSPAKNTTLDAYLEDYAQTTGSRSGNHWMGSCKMGVDSGLENGTSVVDTNTKVYGMDNLFIVDASIFPEMVTTNPSALIVSVAEHAVEKILALAGTASDTETETETTPAETEVSPSAGNSTTSAVPSSLPEITSSSTVASATMPASNNSTSVAVPAASSTAAQEPAVSSAPASSTSATKPATAASSSSAAAPAASSTGSSTATVAAVWERCGGGDGETKACAEGSTCKVWSDYYSQCVPPNLQ